MIDLVYENEVAEFQENFEEDFLSLVETTLTELMITDDVELSVILVDDERIHEINRDYRHIDRPTDVISFALEEGETLDIEGLPRNLGDIFISVERAREQAQDYGHSLRREMISLSIALSDISESLSIAVTVFSVYFSSMFLKFSRNFENLVYP